MKKKKKNNKTGKRKKNILRPKKVSKQEVKEGGRGENNGGSFPFLCLFPRAAWHYIALNFFLVPRPESRLWLYEIIELDRFTRSIPPLHCGLKQTRIEMKVLGHSLVRLLVRSHRSLVHLLRTALFARTLRFAHSFFRLLTSLTP